MKKVGNYLLVSKIGEGQFGLVYKATDQNTDEVYAVKAIQKSKVNSNPKLRKLFDTEMAVMSMIDHPNVLHLHEYLETTNNYYLVIQYCNNGDLENHVKKNSYLGEQESVYFLMQIMNGFRELHKHKIMHRDFKLANIFLNDDNIIIGDFGFAKSGFDMATTKLGSPITMAPELLNAPNGKVQYNNKADLWSIGVCFFQMIFGKPPWDAKNLKDLQRLVKSQSGDNLVIPASPATSKECKDLLRRLITESPEKRIDWSDFFNHPIFDKAEEGEGSDMKQSVMFRNHEDRVAKMFNNNKKDGPKEVDLVDPLEIELQVSPEEKKDDSNDQKEKERALKRARQRFTHEKKIIVFIMHTCRKLRNLAKQREELGDCATNFMYSALLLLKKGIMLNELAINAIKQNKNLYGVELFDSFLASDNCSQILKELAKDNKLYLTLLNHLQKKLREETTPSATRSQEILALSSGSSSTFESLNTEIEGESRIAFQFYSQRARSFGSQLRRELAIGMAHLFLSSHSEVEFKYKQDTGFFDWQEFEKKLNMDFVHQCIERGLQEI